MTAPTRPCAAPSDPSSPKYRTYLVLLTLPSVLSPLPSPPLPPSLARSTLTLASGPCDCPTLSHSCSACCRRRFFSSRSASLAPSSSSLRLLQNSSPASALPRRSLAAATSPVAPLPHQCAAEQLLSVICYHRHSLPNRSPLPRTPSSTPRLSHFRRAAPVPARDSRDRPRPSTYPSSPRRPRPHSACVQVTPAIPSVVIDIVATSNSYFVCQTPLCSASAPYP